MSPLEQYRREIHQVCAAHKVVGLYAFSSVLGKKFNNNSDVDLIVEFDAIDVEAYADNYFDLEFSSQDVLHRSVELLEKQALKNPYFLKAISPHCKLIYRKLTKHKAIR